MRIVRVAVCQLRIHPAIYAGHVAYPEEPFVPKPGGPSLSRLGSLGVDVAALQSYCRKEYADWIRTRLAAVIEFLRRTQINPDIVLFPEGAVPQEMLPQLGSWSSASGATILAGTHTPVNTAAAISSYAALGISPSERKRAARAPAGSVLPLIRNGKGALLHKRFASPFELSDVSENREEAVPSTAYAIVTGAGKLNLLPLVCIEALRLQNVKNSYDVVGVVSCDAKPEQFQPFIDQQVRNRKLVLYCNDGHAGKSRFGVLHDDRAPSLLRDSMPDGLPPGDALLVADLNLDATAIEVGTAVPRVACKLVSLASVVGEHSSSVVASRVLRSVASLPEGAARAEQIAQYLATSPTDRLQELRMNYLGDIERRGLPSAHWWSALGDDCVVTGQDDFEGMEARLAARCRDFLETVLSTEAAQRPELSRLLLQFYAECVKRAGSLEKASAVASAADPVSVIDREGEVRSVTDFLDHRAATVLEVTGLSQIGKSSVVEKALSQSGISAVSRVPLTNTSSAEYIVYALLRRGSGLPAPPYADPVEVARSASFSNALRRQRVIVFERAHLLLDLGNWRDEYLGAVVATIIDVAHREKVKVIFETQRELPIDIADPSLRARLRVSGLYKHLRNFGVAIFDAQLRRVGLSPDILSEESKGTIVERLGGHPVAIAFAADASYEEGGESVLKALKDRKGFYLTFIERLLRPLNITDQDETVLRLLTLARVPVDRAVVLEAAGFPAAPVLRNLIALGTIETSRDGRVEIAGILRDYFDAGELVPGLVHAFHKAAATAFEASARAHTDNLEAAIEAEYHGGIAGMPISVSSKLLDGALAVAHEHFRSQNYDAADLILRVLLQKRRSLDVLRLAAQVAARRNDSAMALSLAREVLQRDPKDTRFLSDLARISLTQHQDTTVKQLIALARSAGVEDESILVVEGRIYLRQHELYEAERVFARARQLTRKNPWPFYYLGSTYQRMGRLDDAIDMFEQGLEFFYGHELRGRRALSAIRTQLGLSYLFNDNLEAAAQHLDYLIEEDSSSPEVIRAYAALTIRRDGIQMAEKAFQRLSKAKIRNRFDKCQFHLFYGLFYLGIDNPHEASYQFGLAHAADRSNVYVMMKWARTLYDIATERTLDGDEMHKGYVSDCKRLVQKILEFDPDNPEGVSLMNSLHQFFDADLEGATPADDLADRHA